MTNKDNNRLALSSNSKRFALNFASFNLLGQTKSNSSLDSTSLECSVSDSLLDLPSAKTRTFSDGIYTQIPFLSNVALCNMGPFHKTE